MYLDQVLGSELEHQDLEGQNPLRHCTNACTDPDSAETAARQAVISIPWCSYMIYTCT